MMKIPRVYVDTSVFGGVMDEEFAEPSRRFFDLVKRGRYSVLVSALTLRELEGAPESVRALLDALSEGAVEEVAINAEVEALALAYVDAGALAESHTADAIHVAAATIGRADVVVSWNFRHLVNYDRIRKYNGVNELKGYPRVEIRSPLDMGSADEDEDL